MFDFWLFEFAIAVLIVIGIVALIVKLISLPKGEKFDPLRWKKFGLGLAIALIFPFMVMYGFASFTTEPVADYSYYQLEPAENYNRETRNKIYFSPSGESISVEQYQVFREKYQDERAKQQQEYRDKMETFHTYLFITMVGFGVAAIVAGIFLAIPAASTGVLFGGVASVGIGYIDYLSYMNEVAIFVSLLLAFIALFYVAYKKFNREEEPGAILHGKKKLTK